METPQSLSPYINRELSWVEFNRRVLEEAQNPHWPALERAKFLAIFATNLDEFYMVRLSGLHERVDAGVVEPAIDGLTPAQVLERVNTAVRPLQAEHAQTWQSGVRPLLTKYGVCVLDWSDLNSEQREFATEFFRREVFPILTPLGVDPAHPFPHISNLSLNLAVIVCDENGVERFARVKVPPSLPRLFALNDCADDATCQRCFVWLEQIIAANIGDLFPGLKILGSYAFRVTRDADVEIKEDEADDLLTTIEASIRERKFGDAIRLEAAGNMPPVALELLIANFKVQEQDVFHIYGALDLSCLWQLLKLPLPALKDPPLQPYLPRDLNVGEGADIFARIRRGDVLLHHPYDSFAPVVNFIRTAARDPNVLAIKQTLYRVGSNSPVVAALMEAAENGKQVAVLVELKARFDEENNIQWSRTMEKLGVHVVYGLPGYKVHSKICLVVRRDEDGVRRYVHLGTGNYNATTARIYTDLGLLTCDEQIGQDATDVFNFLTGYSKQKQYDKLLVAPVSLRRRLTALIEREIEQHLAHGGGHLICKMNQLTDPPMIDLLYRASQTGVKIDLIVRGICCLRPGVTKLSETIRVVSIVGRFLEHSRVFWFRNNGQEKVYSGSADLMERNLSHRVEVVFPVLDPALRDRIKSQVLDLSLSDNIQARELLNDGSYAPVTHGRDERLIDSQQELLRHVGHTAHPPHTAIVRP